MENKLTFEQEVLFWKGEMERIDREIKEGYEYSEEEINCPYEELNRLTVEKLERERPRIITVTNSTGTYTWVDEKNTPWEIKDQPKPTIEYKILE